jgi:hypothetical protein
MSDARIEANRQNAQHSTGPQTEAGKAASSQNARRHGLNSATLFIPADCQEEFLGLHQSLFAEIRPVGELQAQFFEQLVHASWNINIARRLLAAALAQMDDRKIANANRYVNQYERSFARALKEIKALQTDLALRAVDENEPIADLPFTCEIKAITREATKIAHLTERTQRPAARYAVLTHIGASFRPFAPNPDLAA